MYTRRDFCHLTEGIKEMFLLSSWSASLGKLFNNNRKIVRKNESRNEVDELTFVTLRDIFLMFQ